MEEVKTETKEEEQKIVNVAEQVVDESWTDYILDKILSRKLLVFIVATILLIFGKLDNTSWVLISSIYVGSQSIIEVISNWKNKKESE
jgi:hypothetical protein